MNTKAKQTPRSDSRAARAEAAAWIVRLHGPQRTQQLEAAFRHWLSEDEENAHQFERVTEVWDDAKTISAAGLPRLSYWQNPHFPRHSSFAHVWARAAIVLVVCAIAFFGAYRIWFDGLYSTGIGEQRIVRLSDGTRVTLNSATRIEIDYTDAQRRVQLKKGEAFFEVARNPRKPFRVNAGTHQVTAIGTSFIVRYEPDSTAVTLIEGKVTVTEETSSPMHAEAESSHAARPADASKPPSDAVTLAPGQRLILAKHTPPKLDAPRIEAVTAWRRGEVMLDKTALADAIAEMNRYDQTTLVIDDPGIAGLKISGIYHTGDSKGFARTVAKLYRLEVTESTGEIRLTGNPTPAAPPLP